MTNRPQNSQHSCQSESPMFVVGMQRSGTTLMSRILSSHSNICIAPESHYLNYWMSRLAASQAHLDSKREKFWEDFSSSKRFAYFGLAPEPLLAEITNTFKAQSASCDFEAHFHKVVFSCVLQQYAKGLNKPRWGEKTPAHYAHISTLLSWYPDARVIFMTRDPRSVAASMKKVPWGGNSILSFSLRWQDSIQHLKLWQSDCRVHHVSYEDLVNHPESSLSDICSFVGESYEAEMLTAASHTSSSASLYDSKWARSHLCAAAGEINTRSLESWRTTLSNCEVALVEYIAKQGMDELGYTPSQPAPALKDRMLVQTYRLGKQLRPYLKAFSFKASYPFRKWA